MNKYTLLKIATIRAETSLEAVKIYNENPLEYDRIIKGLGDEIVLSENQLAELQEDIRTEYNIKEK